jgi:hypothetical protein
MRFVRLGACENEPICGCRDSSPEKPLDKHCFDAKVDGGIRVLMEETAVRRLEC